MTPSTPLPEQFKTGTYFGESGFSSTLPPALPEQGGFNERLTEILATAIEKNVRDGMRYGAKQEREKIAIFPFSIDEPVGELRAAIRTLVLEEIIGRDDPYRKGLSNLAAVDNFVKAQRNQLRAEQRKKLGGSDGTK